MNQDQYFLNHNIEFISAFQMCYLKQIWKARAQIQAFHIK